MFYAFFFVDCCFVKCYLTLHKGLNGVQVDFTYLGLIEVLWGLTKRKYLFGDSSISGVLDRDLIVHKGIMFYQVKVTTWQIFEQTESSKWCDHISSYGHLRKQTSRLFLPFFSEGPKSKSVCEWFIDLKNVLRHSFSLIL